MTQQIPPRLVERRRELGERISASMAAIDKLEVEKRIHHIDRASSISAKPESCISATLC